MNVLLLGPDRPSLIRFMTSCGDNIIRREMISSDDAELIRDVNFIVSYGCRHIISAELLRHFQNRVINLHISLLPWNRGADPNVWSFLEDTPKGVTIHYIDSGIDTGNIIAQRELSIGAGETLRTAYNKLSEEIENLFYEQWISIRVGNAKDIPQPDGGSFHLKKDLQSYKHLFIHGWDTPVSMLIGKGAT